MLDLSFAQWLKLHEVGTSTACVAGFARPLMGVVRRKFVGAWGDEDSTSEKKRRKKFSEGVADEQKEGTGGGD